MKNLPSKILAYSASLPMLITPVFADGIGTGSLEETKNAFAPVFEKLGPLVSAGVNITSIVLTVFFIIKGVFNLIQYVGEENPNEKKAKQKSWMFSFAAAAIALLATIVINVVLASFGVDIFKLIA